MHRPLCTCLLLISVLLVCASRPAEAQTADQLFDAGRLHDVHVMMHPRDFRLLVEHYQENTYYPADIRLGNLRMRAAAVRSRGRASRVPDKPGLLIDFGRYVSGGRVLGLESLVLDNRWQDPALFREAVTMAVFNRMGIAAPRESFCRVFINGVYYGVYALVEAVDASFVERRFGDRDGFLFEYQNVRPFVGEYLGEDLDEYKPFFEPRTRRMEPEATLYAPIHDLFREVNHDDDGVWRERVERYLDVEQFVRYVAVETFMAEPDGILGSNGMSNFYLYRPAGSPRHQLIPWDKDLSFDNPEFDLFRRADQNHLFSRLIAYPDLLDLYLRTLEEAAALALADDWLYGEVARTAALIDDAARTDSRKASTNEEFAERVQYLLDFARFRPDYILREVAALR